MSKLSKTIVSARMRIDPGYRVVKVANRNSLCGKERLRGLQKVAGEAAARRIEGAFVECGVYRGGSAAVISERLWRVNPSIPVYLFDVFSGMPEPGPNDPPEAWDDVGKFVSSEQMVRETFSAAGLPTERVNFVVGRYEQTMLGFESPPSISFLHVDCDWFDSIMLVLEKFYDRVATGGTIVFDDYGHWSGCRKAVDEFFARRSVQATLKPIDYTSHHMVKP